MFGHLILHDSFLRDIIEGKIDEKRGKGKPRRRYLDEIKEKVMSSR